MFHLGFHANMERLKDLCLSIEIKALVCLFFTLDKMSTQDSEMHPDRMSSFMREVMIY